MTITLSPHMADESETPPSTESAAPAEPAQDTVTIELGQDLGIYPEGLRPAETAPTPSPAPEADLPAEPSNAVVVEAGSAPRPDQAQPQGSPRRANEDAYQRGLREGVERYEREQAERLKRETAEQTQRDAAARVEKLFTDLASNDWATVDRARQALGQMYGGNREAQALQNATRQQILQEMAADFTKLRDLEGVGDDDYKELHSAPSAADLAKRAYALGKKAEADRIARLEAELQGLRGRLVGSRATPERANGSTHSDADRISLEEYATLSPKEARKLSAAQIDSITAQLQAEAERSRS